MQFPLKFSFKLLALSPQIYINDALNSPAFYVKQKMFKLKEDIRVFRSNKQVEELASIKADRILDFSACYHFTDPDGSVFGAVRRKGWRSIWKTHYQVLDEEDVHQLDIREDSAMVKVIDALVGEIPIIGFLLTMIINPSYTISDLDGNALFHFKKMPAFFEGKFELHKVDEDVDEAIEQRSIMAVMMMALLERRRG